MKNAGWLAFASALWVHGAEAANNTIVATGIGGYTCAQFTSALNNNPYAELMYFHWAQGFLSGQNLAPTLASRSVKDLTSISEESQKLLLRVYCNEHPTEPVMRAVSSVWDALKTVPSN
jgi:hypothetical protein